MSFLGRVFGADKAVEKTIETARQLVDEAFYTRQEESEDKRAAASEARGLLIRWLETTSPSRLARRVIALGITGTWLALFIGSTLFSLASVWAGAQADRLLASAALVDNRISIMTPAVMLILGFYFAAPHMGAIAESALKRFGEQK